MSTHPHNHASGHACCGAKALDGAATVKDPVCGKSVDLTTTAHRASHGGQDYFFCSAGCRTKCIGDPRRCLSPRGEAEPAVPGAIYTGPMHPEIGQEGPGSCPICGMALKPMIPSDEPSHELTDFTRRLWDSVAAAVPLLILTLGALVGMPVRDWIGYRTAAWLELLLSSPIVLWAARPFFQRGLDSFKNRSPNMWTLISLGVGAAYLYSLFATFLPGIFPEEYRMGGMVGTYYEAAVVIVALVGGIWPALFAGFHLLATRKDKMAEQKTNEGEV